MLLATQLMLVARLIKGGLGTPVYLVSLSGFDTHANQNQYHPGLWAGISEAVSSFYKDLEVDGWDDKVLTMSFSEFGRRVKQNAANGTDHGTANTLFVIGKQLKTPGIYNDLASLVDLDDNGDLKYEIDFRTVYATILNRWLGADDKSVLGGSHGKLDFI